MGRGHWAALKATMLLTGVRGSRADATEEVATDPCSLSSSESPPLSLSVLRGRSRCCTGARDRSSNETATGERATYPFWASVKKRERGLVGPDGGELWLEEDTEDEGEGAGEQDGEVLEGDVAQEGALYPRAEETEGNTCLKKERSACCKACGRSSVTSDPHASTCHANSSSQDESAPREPRVNA